MENSAIKKYQNKTSKNKEFVPEMPKLEDINDNDEITSQRGNFKNQFYKKKNQRYHKNKEFVPEMPKLEDINDNDEITSQRGNFRNQFTTKGNHHYYKNTEMPELEDIKDDNNANLCDRDNGLSNKSSTRKTTPVDMSKSKEKTTFKSFEDSLNIQPDPNGLFSLCINKKDSYLRSENVIQTIFIKYGSVSSISFVKDMILVKMPSRQQAINSFKALGQELNMSIGDNSLETNSIKSNQNKDPVKIYIGNVSLKASNEKLLKFFAGVKIINLKLINNKTKAYAFAILPDMLEAEKAIEMYNFKIFQGQKLFVKLYENYKKTEIPSEMPELEDIKDDNNANLCDRDDGLSSKSSTSKTISVDMSKSKEKKTFKTSDILYQSPCKNDNSSDKTIKDWISSLNDSAPKHNNQSKHLIPDHVTLFVGNFPIEMSEEQLLSLFKDFHPSSVNIINNHNMNRSTQALINFPNPQKAEQAICKFDKAVFRHNTLLVTSVGFCPCFNNQKFEQLGQAPSPSMPPLSNGSSLLDKIFEKMDVSSTVKHQQWQQQQRVNVKDSVRQKSENEKTLTANDLQDKKKQNQQTKNEPLKSFQVDNPFKTEAAKMEILIKHFKVQPCLSSSSEIFQVLVTSVVNDELFWGNIFSSLHGDLIAYMDMHNQLQSYALNWPKYNLSKINMKCVALYQGEWYRAWVLNSDGKDMVKVFFLDYGNISQIDLKDVRFSYDFIWKLPPKAKAFRIASNSPKLPTNPENLLVNIEICKSGSKENGFISVASLVSKKEI